MFLKLWILCGMLCLQLVYGADEEEEALKRAVQASLATHQEEEEMRRVLEQSRLEEAERQQQIALKAEADQQAIQTRERARLMPVHVIQLYDHCNGHAPREFTHGFVPTYGGDMSRLIVHVLVKNPFSAMTAILQNMGGYAERQNMGALGNYNSSLQYARDLGDVHRTLLASCAEPVREYASEFLGRLTDDDDLQKHLVQLSACNALTIFYRDIYSHCTAEERLEKSLTEITPENMSKMHLLIEKLLNAIDAGFSFKHITQKIHNPMFAHETGFLTLRTLERKKIWLSEKWGELRGELIGGIQNCVAQTNAALRDAGLPPLILLDVAGKM